jgi:hypothetical protein
MTALNAIKKKTAGASSNNERTVLLREALDSWDTATLGDWEDAVVVAARREGISSPKIYLLLAAVAGEIPRTTSGHTFDNNHLKRASEIGRSLEKISKRDAKDAAKLIKRGGGVKKLSDGKTRVPKKTKIRIDFRRKT